MDEAPRKLLSLSEWESMYEQMVATAGVTAKTLNSFDQISHKAQVYGEAMPLLVDALIDIAQIKPTDVFFDIGSGIGNIVLQIAAQTGCKAYGIEIRQDLHQLAEGLLEQFNKEYTTRGATPPEVKLIGGDALADSFEIDQYYVNSTIVFMNNWCFPPTLEQGLCLKFEAMLQKDVKLIALKNLFPREEPWKQRYRDSPVQIFKLPWIRYKFPEGCISWAHRPITAYIYTVDREFDFEKKVAFFDAQSKKNKNYKGRVTHMIHFDDTGKMEVKEVDDTEEKQKVPKENKLPKVNDFVDLVTSSRDSASSSSSVKAPKPKPQPSANGAPPKPRKFRRRGKTPFLTDREGDDYICLTCRAKDRMPWRFKMSQQIAAHVRLHQFNPYRFDDDDEGEEEDDEVSNTNQNVPLIDISNEKSTTNNGADEFAALISLMSIAQAETAMQIEQVPAEPIVEQVSIGNNVNVQPEIEKGIEPERPAVVNTSSKKPGELSMSSRLTDSLTIDPMEIQRTRERLAEKHQKEKEAAKANGEVIKPPKKPKLKTSNGTPKEGTADKKKSGEKSVPNGLKTSKDKSKKTPTPTPTAVASTTSTSSELVSPDPSGKYIIVEGVSFEYTPGGELRQVSLRRATAHEPKSKRIVDNFPELPSERRSRKLTKSKNDNTATNEAPKQSDSTVHEENKQENNTADQPVAVTSEKPEQHVAQSELPLINPELHIALKDRFGIAPNGEMIPGPNFQGVPPVVMQHFTAHPHAHLPAINGLKHAPQAQATESQVRSNETARPVESAKSPTNQRPGPINGIKPKRSQAPSSNLVDALPVVRSSSPDLVAKRVNDLTKSDEAWRTKRSQGTEQQAAPAHSEAPIDRMDIVQDEPAAETTPTIASVEQAAQAMDVTPATELTDRRPAEDSAMANGAGEHQSETVHDRAVDELPTAEVNASPADSYMSAQPEAAHKTSSQAVPMDVHTVEMRPVVEDAQPTVVSEPQTDIAVSVPSKPEESGVPQLIVTPAVIEVQPAQVLASMEEMSASERESVKEERSKSASKKKRKRTASTNENPDAPKQDSNNTDANSTTQSAQPKPKKRRFETELSGLFHGQINYDYKIDKEFLYSSKRSCVVKKETPAAAPKAPSRPMTSSPQPRARSRKAGANDPALKTPPVSPIKFDLKDDEERSTSAKPKPKKKNNTNTENNNNNTNKNPDPEPIVAITENKPKSSPTKQPKKITEKPIEKTTTNIAPEEVVELVNTNNNTTANKAPARPRSKSKSKPKDLAESILAKVSNLTPIKNANKNLPKPKLPSKSKKSSASRSESPSNSIPSSPSKHAPLVRNASTAAALLLLADKELIETSTVAALHSTNALIPDALSDNERIALSAIATTDMEIIDTAQHHQYEAGVNKPAERQVVDISGLNDAEPERMIDIATDADAHEAPVHSENVPTTVHLDSAHVPERHAPVISDSVPHEQRPEVQESQQSKSAEHSVAAAEVEPMSDQSVDQTMNDSANNKLLEAIEAHVISRQVVPDAAASTRPSTASADPAPVTNMSLLQSIEYLKSSALMEPAGTVDVLPDNEQSSYFATIANYQDVDDDEDDDILLLPTDS